MIPQMLATNSCVNWNFYILDTMHVGVTFLVQRLGNSRSRVEHHSGVMWHLGLYEMQALIPFVPPRSVDGSGMHLPYPYQFTNHIYKHKYGFGKENSYLYPPKQIWIHIIREGNKYGYTLAKRFDDYITIHFN